MDASHKANAAWLIGLLLMLAVCPTPAATNYPVWWSHVIDTNAAPNDFAPATQGQLKWMATKAYEELQTNLSGGAGTGVAGVVSTFSASNNYVLVNVGQLKYVAQPFYERLIAVSYTNAFPWTTNSTGDDADFAPANLGQLKNVFSFDVTSDTDADSLPDWWEIQYGLNPTMNDASEDPDQDQLNNSNEYAQGTNPKNFDTDGDLLADGAELTRYSTSPTNWDTDGDGNIDWAERLAAFQLYSGLDMCISYLQFYGDHNGVPLVGTLSEKKYEFYYSDDYYTWSLAETDIPGILGTTLWYDYGGDGRRNPGDLQYGRGYTAGLAEDPDGDGLSSAYEALYFKDMHGIYMSPDMPDSNTNGISDGDEDFDNDGLSNSQEYNSPANANYDSCRHGSSSPFAIDSDGDGVCDGPTVPGPYVGITNGPDHFPMDPAGWQDTDCDGMPDSLNASFTSTSYPPLVEDLDDDNDSFSDVDEIAGRTDPKDPYSVPPLSMLRASGKYIVDTNGSPVILKAVNLGAWLQWEQWMLMFEPHLWTNDWGKVYGLKSLGGADEIDEGTAREMLMANVDDAVTLWAADAPLKSSGISIGVVTGGWTWLCPNGVRYAGSFNGGRWIAFTNVHFGSGVSHLAVALAVPSNDAGRQIRVRLDGLNGEEIGSLVTKSTAPVGLSGSAEWCTFTEQYVTLSTNVSGNHDIYFVGSNAASWQAVGNLYRFRFFNDATNTANLFEIFRDNYLSTNDLDRVRELGYNCIRLPFFHTLLEDDYNPYVYKPSGWDRLDGVIEQCRIRRLWVILDLHSTPGGQNPYHASGYREPFRNRMWMSEDFQKRAENLWAEIAKRYATNRTIVGYDLFNEPAPSTGSGWTTAQAFSNNIVPMLTRLHRSIRSNDTQHVLFMESNLMYTNMWAGDYLWWPDPAVQGWTNVAYEFHVYDQTVYGKNGVDDWWFSTQKRICDTMIRSFTRFRDARQVPVFLGEFAPWDERNMEYWIRQCEANDIHWGHWNYRSWGWDDTSTPTKGWTVWGLDYRSKATTNLMPNVMTDSLATLTNKFAQYNPTNYTGHPYLPEVVENHTKNTNAARERTEFYLNRFDGPNADGLSVGWPWKKVAGVGNSGKFYIGNKSARLFIDAGPLVLRCKSREEADARFEVNDSTGCRLSVDLVLVNVTNEAAGPEAEICLSFVRDEITAVTSNYDTRGIIARLAYDKAGASTNIALSLYAKAGGTNTYGVMLFTNAAIAFVPGATIELRVTQTNASLFYNGALQGSAAHTNLALDTWLNGAVALTEVSAIAQGSTERIELDNLKAWRDDAATDTTFTDTFANYASGITVLSEPEYLTTQEYWAPSRKRETYVTNGAVFWIAKEWAYGGTWMSPRRDYQDDVRLLASPTNVVEARAAYSNFTQGVAKICLMPELFTAEIYGEYAGNALYVEFERQGGNVKFTAYRHYGVDGGRSLLQTNGSAYVEGKAVSLQAGTNNVRVYYGTSLIINAAHGMTNYLAVYTNGAFPHYEFQNWSSTTNATVILDDVTCRRLSAFATPE